MLIPTMHLAPDSCPANANVLEKRFTSVYDAGFLLKTFYKVSNPKSVATLMTSPWHHQDFINEIIMSGSPIIVWTVYIHYSVQKKKNNKKKNQFCTLLQGLESQRRLHYHALEKSITDFTIIQYSCVRVAGTLNGCESSALLSLQSCDLYELELRKTLQGYGDVGVSVSFIVAPDNWLQSLEQRRVTLLRGGCEAGGGMTVRVWVREGKRLHRCGFLYSVMSAVFVALDLHVCGGNGGK